MNMNMAKLEIDIHIQHEYEYEYELFISIGEPYTLLETVASTIHAISVRCSISDLPFHTFEIELHDLWYIFIQAARNFSYHNSKQDSLVRYILSTKEMGTMTRTITTDNSSEDQVIHVSDGNIWSDLPFLV